MSGKASKPKASSAAAGAAAPAPAPAAAKKAAGGGRGKVPAAAPAKVAAKPAENPLFPRRPKNLRVGGAVRTGGRDLTRFVKWPRYVSWRERGGEWRRVRARVWWGGCGCFFPFFLACRGRGRCCCALATRSAALTACALAAGGLMQMLAT
jgi:hypothetical protein